MLLAVRELQADMKQLRERLDLLVRLTGPGGVGAGPNAGLVPRHLEGALDAEDGPVTLSEEELLTLGRTLALQLYRGERTTATLSRNEERAVRWFRALAGEDAPTGVPLARRGS